MDLLRIFLSSPSDVADERRLARKLIDHRLRLDPSFRYRAVLEAVTWDDPDAPTPMLAQLPPQQAVDRHLPKPSTCDIVVVILWARMGTPLPPECHKPDGTTYVSGTAAQGTRVEADLRNEASGPFPREGHAVGLVLLREWKHRLVRAEPVGEHQEPGDSVPEGGRARQGQAPGREGCRVGRAGRCSQLPQSLGWVIAVLRLPPTGMSSRIVESGGSAVMSEDRAEGLLEDGAGAPVVHLIEAESRDQMRAGQSRRGFIDMPDARSLRAGAPLKPSVGLAEVMQQGQGCNPVDPDVVEVGDAGEGGQPAARHRMTQESLRAGRDIPAVIRQGMPVQAEIVDAKLPPRANDLTLPRLGHRELHGHAKRQRDKEAHGGLRARAP
jgi:hypothetical protein